MFKRALDVGEERKRRGKFRPVELAINGYYYGMWTLKRYLAVNYLKFNKRCPYTIVEGFGVRISICFKYNNECGTNIDYSNFEYSHEAHFSSTANHEMLIYFEKCVFFTL